MKKKWGASQALRWTGRKLFESSGYQWEVRRAGDLKLGLWRKRLRPQARKNVSVKRFVMVPGFGDSPLTWLVTLALLVPILKRTGYDEIAVVDFPGFNGRLFKEKCFPTMDLLVDAFSGLMDWLEPDALFGHSLGGWLVGRYAADCGAGIRPANRRRHGYEGPNLLFLGAPAGVYENVAAQNEVQRIFNELTADGGFRSLRPHLFAKEPRWFGWIADDMGHFATDPGIRAFTQSVRQDHLLDERLIHIKARTWFIWGDQDTLVPVAGLDTWLKLLPAACEPQAVLIKGAGHSPQLESPAIFSAVIAQIVLGRTPHVRGTRWWGVRRPEPVSS